MKKITILLTTMFLSFSGFSKEIILKKQGGRKCSLFSSEICYDLVRIRDTPEKYRQECTGNGPNSCPKLGVITVGAMQFDVDNFVSNIEQNILSGITSGSGFITDQAGQIRASYVWTGEMNVEGNIEYEIHINDEV
jgi:hypothetical protein